MKKILSSFICFALVGLVGLAAQPTPAPAQTESILIMNATAHIGDGRVIQNAVIGLENGKITLVADATTVRVDMTKFKKVIEATGKHVYPSLIAPNTPLGLAEVESVRATVDHTEIGELNPSIRSIIAYNTDSHILPTVRSNGILLAQVTPNGGTISGSSSVVQLDAWNWEDAAYKMDEGIHVRFPGLIGGGFDFSEGAVSVRKNDQYAKQVAAIDDFMREALAYTKKDKVDTKNLKFEAMRGVFDKTKTLYLHANLAKEIADAVLLGKKYGCRMVIVGGKDSWMVTDLLKENDVAVVLSETQDLPSRPDDDYDQPYKSPSMLQKAGVLYCMSVGGGWQQRNLPLMAGQAVAYGLDKEQAVVAITSNAAKILGIDKTVGTLEQGKDATLFISEGDVLDMRTSIVTHAFIQGRAIDLDNKHKQLYRRFQTKYDRQKGK